VNCHIFNNIQLSLTNIKCLLFHLGGRTDELLKVLLKCTCLTERTRVKTSFHSKSCRTTDKFFRIRTVGRTRCRCRRRPAPAGTSGRSLVRFPLSLSLSVHLLLAFCICVSSKRNTLSLSLSFSLFPSLSVALLKIVAALKIALKCKIN